jgi:hypothetical protein
VSFAQKYTVPGAAVGCRKRVELAALLAILRRRSQTNFLAPKIPAAPALAIKKAFIVTSTCM